MRAEPFWPWDEGYDDIPDEADRCDAPKPGGTTRCIEPKGHTCSHGDGSVIRWLTPDQREPR